MENHQQNKTAYDWEKMFAHHISDVCMCVLSHVLTLWPHGL